MNLKNKKVLITGASGFIGSNLVGRLRQEGSRIDTYDIQNGHDITDTKTLGETIKRGYDVIFHMAAISGPTNIQTAKTFQVNTFATLDICEMLSKYSPKAKLILSSSRLEYGRVKYLPVDEKHPTEPTTSYGLSKLAATQLALIYHLKNKLDVTVFRTSNVYGPHVKNGFKGYNIVNYFIDQSLKNADLTIYGGGKQERDYVYVDDLIDAFILGLDKKAGGQIYNLGYGKGISLKNMAALIIKITGKGKLKFVKWPDDYREIETGSYISKITKLKKELGFKPKVTFAEGIKKTLSSISEK